MELQFDLLRMLGDLDNEHGDFVDEELTKDFEKEIYDMGLTWNSTLTDVMLKGNWLTVDKTTDMQSNFFDIYKTNLTQKLAASNFKSLTKQNFINITRHRYAEMIVSKGNIVKPLREWPRNALAYFSIQQGLDLTLDDLYFFILFPDFECIPIVDSFTVGNALHEFSQGTADAILLQTLTNKEVDNISIPQLLEDFKNLAEHISTNSLNSKKELSQIQMITWLNKLGIIDAVKEHCREGATYNFRKMARIIGSFTIGVNIETVRKYLEALLHNETDNPNYPLQEAHTDFIEVYSKKILKTK